MSETVWTGGGSGGFVLPEAGTDTAICIRIIGLGTQTDTYQGKTSSRRKVMLVFELPNQINNGEPLTISKVYTESLNEKATLRHDLQAWRGRDFTPEELAGFKPRNLLRKACLLTILHRNSTSLSGQSRTKADIDGIAALPKGMPAPGAPVHSTYLYDPSNHNPELYASLSQGLQEWIAKSPEYQNAVRPAPVTTYNAPPVTADNDDEIPF